MAQHDKKRIKSKPAPAQKEGKKKRVVVIGGGTGTYTVLSALRPYDLDLTAIVTMADDGGSTGVLRDEFGVLPPGDLRQCLVALSEAPEIMRKLFSHRFDRGGLKGHSFGNLFLSTLEQITGNLDDAIDVVGDVLNIRGKVIPVTLDNITLVSTLKNGMTIQGQVALEQSALVSRFGIKSMKLSPRARANTKAIQAIKDADVIIVGPGNLYCSLIPNFLVRDISRAMQRSGAQKIYIANLMNKYGHTDGFQPADYVAAVEGVIGGKVFDTVLFNTEEPSPLLMKKYAEEGTPVYAGATLLLKGRTAVGAPLLSSKAHKAKKGDTLRRTFIRHDIKKLGAAISRLIDS